MTLHAHILTVKRNGKKVTKCDNPVAHQPAPKRIVGHHILPQVCGGKTTPGNIAALCDNCHYTVHIAMWLLVKQPSKFAGLRLGQYLHELAYQGFTAALAEGTENLMPNEADLS